MSNIALCSCGEKALKGSSIFRLSTPGSGGTSTPVRKSRKSRFSSSVRPSITAQKASTKGVHSAISSSMETLKMRRMSMPRLWESVGQTICRTSLEATPRRRPSGATDQKPFCTSSIASGTMRDFTCSATYSSRLISAGSASNSLSWVNCACFIFRHFFSDAWRTSSKPTRSASVGGPPLRNRMRKNSTGRTKEILQLLAIAKAISFPKLLKRLRRSWPFGMLRVLAYALNHCCPVPRWNSKRGWTGLCNSHLPATEGAEGVLSKRSPTMSAGSGPWRTAVMTRSASVPSVNSNRSLSPTPARARQRRRSPSASPGLSGDP
mmetsp:Transcript_54067/g.168833  ORF Transcript_54067/g.168833 Transcript_54067/m.168833 type:complete len:321 (+) Transcript_54067:125-1087(+)